MTNSTRAELDRLGLTALRAVVDVEPYGSSDLGGDPSDDEPPSMTSTSPLEDDDPEDPEDPKGKKKKKKKKKTRRPEGRRSQEAKAIATSKIVVNLPEFTGKDLSEFPENFGRFLRLTGQTHASGRVKCDLLLQCCKTKYLEKQVRQIVTNSATFADVLVALERQYPTWETNLSIRAEIQNRPVLPNNPKPGRVSELLADLHHRCTITCAFCGKRKHYEDECYHKQRLSAKLKGEDPGKGSGKGGGKGKGNDSGKGKSKGRGQGQDKGQGGRGGGANRQPDNKNKDKNGGNPNPNPGGNSEPSGGQSGPTTRSQTQAQQEQGAKREHEGGDDGNAKERSRFMRMARKLRNKGFEVTCPAEF